MLEDFLRFAAWDGLDNAVDDVVGGDAFGFGVEGWDNAMAQHGFGQRDNVVVRNMEAAAQDGADFAAEDEVLAGTRAGAPVDEIFDKRRSVGGFWARVADDIQDEVHHMIRHGDFADDFLQFEDRRAIDDRFDVSTERTGGTGHDLALILAARI